MEVLEAVVESYVNLVLFVKTVKSNFQNNKSTVIMVTWSYHDVYGHA